MYPRLDRTSRASRHAAPTSPTGTVLADGRSGDDDGGGAVAAAPARHIGGVHLEVREAPARQVSGAQLGDLDVELGAGAAPAVLRQARRAHAPQDLADLAGRDARGEHLRGGADDGAVDVAPALNYPLGEVGPLAQLGDPGRDGSQLGLELAPPKAFRA